MYGHTNIGMAIIHTNIGMDIIRAYIIDA